MTGPGSAHAISTAATAASDSAPFIRALADVIPLIGHAGVLLRRHVDRPMRLHRFEEVGA